MERIKVIDHITGEASNLAGPYVATGNAELWQIFCLYQDVQGASLIPVTQDATKFQTLNDGDHEWSNYAIAVPS